MLASSPSFALSVCPAFFFVTPRALMVMIDDCGLYTVSRPVCSLRCRFQHRSVLVIVTVKVTSTQSWPTDDCVAHTSADRRDSLASSQQDEGE